MNLESIKVHYILGLGRSGTTLLLKELGRSQGVISNPESLFALDFLYVFEPEKVLTTKEIDFFLTRIFSLKTGRFVHLDLWNIDKNKLREAIQAHSPIQFKNVIKLVNLYSEIGRKTLDPQIIIDKNPPYTVHFEQLSKLDINSKFIGIYRHYWDNILSRNKYKLDAINHPYYHALMWCLYNESLLKSKNKTPEMVLLIRYEELVNNPEEHLDTARNFMNLSINLKSQKENYLAEDFLLTLKNSDDKKQFLEMHSKVFNEIDTKAIGKKNENFTKNQINAIHFICNSTSQKLGYESERFHKPSHAQRILITWFKCVLWFVEIKHHAYYRASHKKRKLLKIVTQPWLLFHKKA